MFESSGTIFVSGNNQKPGWYYLKVDLEIAVYYNWLLYRKTGIKYQLPLNGPHITFIAGEKDDRIVLPQEILPYINNIIPFTYDPTIYTNGRAFWMPAWSPLLDNIRLKMGLKPKSNGLHMTLGNIKNANK